MRFVYQVRGRDPLLRIFLGGGKWRYRIEPASESASRVSTTYRWNLWMSSILMLTLVSATGCTNAGGTDDAGTRFESLGAEVERNDDGQVVAIRTHITDPPDRKGTKATDADLAAVAQLTSLKDLRLAGTRVRGTGLANLQGLDQLKTLDLTETQITDTALAHLQGLPNLRELRLQNCRALTNDGLQHLHDCKQLARLDIRGIHSVREAGISALKRALPECAVSMPGYRQDGPAR